MGDDPGPGCLEMNIWSVIRAAREHGGDLVSQSSLTVRTGEVTRTRPKVPRYVPRQPGPAWLCCQLIRTVWPLTTFRFLIILIIFGCRERTKKQAFRVPWNNRHLYVISSVVPAEARVALRVIGQSRPKSHSSAISFPSPIHRLVPGAANDSPARPSICCWVEGERLGCGPIVVRR